MKVKRVPSDKDYNGRPKAPTGIVESVCDKGIFLDNQIEIVVTASSSAPSRQLNCARLNSRARHPRALFYSVHSRGRL